MQPLWNEEWNILRRLAPIDDADLMQIALAVDLAITSGIISLNYFST